MCTPSILSDHRQAGERLVRELRERFPDQVTSISFEQSALDPPALFIDLASTLDGEEQLRFLCEELVPHIRAVDDAIQATVSYGWWDEDC